MLLPSLIVAHPLQQMLPYRYTANDTYLMDETGVVVCLFDLYFYLGRDPVNRSWLHSWYTITTVSVRATHSWYTITTVSVRATASNLALHIDKLA